MKAWKGVVITTYQEELTVLADTKEQAELLMYDRANPVGDSVNGEMEVYEVHEVQPNQALLRYRLLDSVCSFDFRFICLEKVIC